MTAPASAQAAHETGSPPARSTTSATRKQIRHGASAHCGAGGRETTGAGRTSNSLNQASRFTPPLSRPGDDRGYQTTVWYGWFMVATMPSRPTMA